MKKKQNKTVKTRSEVTAKAQEKQHNLLPAFAMKI